MTQPPQYPAHFYPEQQQPPQFQPGYQPFPPPKPPISPQKKGLLLVSGVLGVFLVAFLILGIGTSTGSQPTLSSNQGVGTARPHGSSASDEKQIRQTIAGMSEAARANDYKKMVSYICAKYRDVLEAIGGKGDTPNLGSLTKPRNGPSKITRIEIHGDAAVVYATDNAGEHAVEFKKESEGWKFCPDMK
jgi:hypothetical protein